MRFSEIIGGIKTVRRFWFLLVLGLGGYTLTRYNGISVGTFIENLSMGLAFGSIACFVGAVYLRHVMPMGYSLEAVMYDLLLMGLTALLLKAASTFSLIPAIANLYLGIGYACIGFLVLYAYGFRK